VEQHGVEQILTVEAAMLAADDDQTKFSEFAICGVEIPTRYCALRAFASPARLPEIPSWTASILTIWVTLHSFG
jgi:hypothetical protein